VVRKPVKVPNLRGARWRRGGGVLVLALALLSPMLTLNGVATASSNNVDLDGTWHIVAADGNGVMVVANENVSTGTFGGTLSGSGVSFRIIAGQVTGTNFTMTIEVAGTVVGEHGEQIDYKGVVTGNNMTITSTASRAWANGKLVEGDSPGTYHGTRIGSHTISGTVTTGGGGCGASSCGGSAEPVADVEVVARGGGETYTATTDDEGKYQMDVPKGAFTLSSQDPAVTFAPATREVSPDGPYDDQDFGACAAGDPDGLGSTSHAHEAPRLERANATAPFANLYGGPCPNFIDVYDLNQATRTIGVGWAVFTRSCHQDNGNDRDYAIIAKKSPTVVFNGKWGYTIEHNQIVVRVDADSPTGGQALAAVVTVSASGKSGHASVYSAVVAPVNRSNGFLCSAQSQEDIPLTTTLPAFPK
jgi:hypothetical protein